MQSNYLILKNQLSQFLGIETTDINNDDSLRDDLHMTPSDIFDFIHNLDVDIFDVSKISLENIETFQDLADAFDIEIIPD